MGREASGERKGGGKHQREKENRQTTKYVRDGVRRGGGALTEVREVNVHAIRLEATQPVYKVLFLQPECGFILTVEEAMDRHIRMGMGRGIKMCGHWEILFFLADQA